MLIDYFVRVATYDLWKIPIELFFISLVVYWAVDFLEGTRGERLFRGVIFILIAGFLVLKLVSNHFKFERLEYLYNGFLVFVLVIAVAAFQPEIRRALIRITQPRFLIGSSQQLAMVAEEITAAATQLSTTKTGAIIVVENKVALGEFIESGVPIDAQVACDLLKSIFYPGSPLHDMAVVIRSDRIIAARIQLPLAEADNIDGIKLGSRHRAAIGLSSCCDATVIVVSEETGVISVSQDGHLKRNLSESDLRECLSNIIKTGRPSNERFWRFSRK